MKMREESEVSVDKSREEFDKWFKSEYHPDKTGPYIKDIMRFAWHASRAAVVVELPKDVTNVTNKAYEEGRDDVITAIEKAGITVKGDE